VRYPIYAALIAFLTGITLVTASWFFPALLVVSIVFLVLRIPKEEKMLVEDIGDAYRAEERVFAAESAGVRRRL
jgi:protein-S-isoprenylcysteine O-methyltransferase Ste14